MLRKRMEVAALPLALTGAFLAGCASTVGSPTATSSTAYWTDTAGRPIVQASGECVRTGTWRTDLATPQCDLNLAKTAAAEAAAREAAAKEAAAREAAAQEAAAREAAAKEAAEKEAAAAAAAAAAAKAAEPVRRFVGTDAYFAFNQAELSDQARRGLDRVAERAQNKEDVTVRVIGFADQIGGDDYNMSLSQRRADAVRTYLIERGVSENAVSVEARGESDPIVQCEGRQSASLIQCLQPNRRTEVEVSLLEPVQ